MYNPACKLQARTDVVTQLYKLENSKENSRNSLAKKLFGHTVHAIHRDEPKKTFRLYKEAEEALGLPIRHREHFSGCAMALFEQALLLASSTAMRPNNQTKA